MSMSITDAADNQQPTSALSQAPRGADAAKAEAAGEVPRPPRRRRRAERPRAKKRAVALLLPVIGLALLAGGAWYGYDYWTDGRFMVSTDDAYVAGRHGVVSPKIPAMSTGSGSARTSGSRRATAGRRSTTATTASRWRRPRRRSPRQDKTLKRIEAQIEGGAGRAAAGRGPEGIGRRPPADNAGALGRRATQLLATKVATQAQVDDAAAALAQANAALAGADAQIAAAKANVGVLKAQYASRRARCARSGSAATRRARPLLHGAAGAL